MRVCAFPGCGREFRAKGYCDTHYRHLKLGRELKPLKVMARDISNETFIRAWQLGDSLEAVATYLRISRIAASDRATKMRRKGIPLKPLRPTRKLSVAEISRLSELAASLLEVRQ